ncbi:MAG: hypothetical protein ACI80H_001758 [Pseudoalteromonas distincta]|jgi:hypothetical protein
MKKQLQMLTLMLVSTVLYVNGQTAEILFLNNNIDAPSLDLEIYNVTEDKIEVTHEEFKYLGRSRKMTVPAGVILQLNFYKGQTSELFYSQKNVVYNTGDLRIAVLFGTASSKRYSVLTGSKGASSSAKIELDFFHSTGDLQEVDLKIRELGTIFADNFKYGDKTFTFDNEFAAADYTLDLTPFDNNHNGLFAYQLPGDQLKGEYALLFTAGTGVANDMYMLQMQGEVTKLLTTTVASIDQINSNKELIKTYPNPAENTITLDCDYPIASISITNQLGQVLIQHNDQLKNNTIDISELPGGMYVLKSITSDGKFSTNNFFKQ